VLMVTVVIILAMGVLGMSMVTTSRMNKTMAANYATHLQSFYAADGEMTLLAQETIDGKFFKYVAGDTGGGLINLALNRPCNDWGENDGTRLPALALDDDLSTYWRSNSVDNQCGMYFDLAASTDVNRIAITWTNEFAMKYELLSWNGSGWDVLAYDIQGGPNSRKVTTFASKTVNNICIWCYGWAPWKNAYGIKEIEAYGVADTGGPGIDTVTLGRFNVIWKMDQTDNHTFKVQTEAYRPNATITNTYKTPLKQYLTVSALDLVNPYGTTVNVPVTYYDFHSDRRNPEFEAPHQHSDVAVPNMVAPTLDGQKKPTLGSFPNFNYYIYYWFRSSSATSPSAKVRLYPSSLAYQVCGPDEAWVGYQSPTGPEVRADSAFANVTINELLTFNHIGNGIYEINQPQFFPLDGKGFGNEWTFNGACLGDPSATHNYAYTMEMHRTFVKVPGQTFKFRGDDDVWLFLNNQLVMDLGGTHYPAEGTLNVDDLDWLEYNHTYSFDFFYCERHSAMADIWIQTNMLVALVTNEKRSWRRDYGSMD
jgi:fibro-slime domain-containing protein